MKPQNQFPQTLVTLAMLAAGAAAQAQSTVTVYGVVDSGVRYSDGLTAAYAPASTATSTLTSGIDTTSRLGFRGTEDLGDGLKAVFSLESGLNVATGATANSTKLFDRAAFLGLQGGWGSLTLGRQTTLLADAVGAVDPLGSRLASFNPNIGIAALSAHGLAQEYGPAGSTTGSYRLDNSMKYVAQVGDFSARAMYAFGAQPNSTSNLSSSGAGLGYQSGAYAASLAYSTLKNVAGLQLKGYVGGVSAAVGAGKVSLSYGDQEAETTATAKTRNKTLGLGGTLPLSANMDLILAHYRVNRTRTANVDDGFNRTVAFLEYKLSKRSLVYAELDQTSWKNGYQGAGLKGSATGVSFGIKHTF